MCNRLVSGTSPEDVQIVFLPFLSCFCRSCTEVMPEPTPKSAFLGITGWHIRAHVVRAIYEGIVFSHETHTAGSELGTLGAAICAGVAACQFESFADAALRMVHIAHTYTPDPAKRDIYAQKYAAYRQAITTLAPLWKHL